ncbi:aminotransferase class I/II-fold pyridoxal phosphate-dependent enzyme [Cellulophaga sp. F20128]|uniref:aminotransferase class I/II-fold pyridoxal phosphate-dependent enzyme n=1 Tax=Cellulophaga sp. F20128 TaxID=2926413 RepID=UPI001FF59846|nr:aminotransferase class I/II-fold pyridoxal phosphate-dependent enzyme [Cellulophaga sp. F20128]MCK0157010.1 aminotransferase class I/II-fold pyridoxal phosphate-dependent enzyme [Cellulophaga sp. F20128]
MTTIVSSFPGRKIKVNGAKKLYFGGTAYLGLQTQPIFLKLYRANLKKYGSNYGASRKANIKIDIFDTAENYLAKVVKSEACITVSSGFLAAQLACNFFKSKGHTVFYAPNSHISLHHYNSKNSSSYSALSKALEKHLKANSKPPVVCMDSLDFNGANYPNFMALQQLPLDKIILISDDSHAINLPLNNGGGCFSLLQQLRPKELVVCTSLGKGFAVQGGALFGTKERMEQLKNTAFYGGASPASPANLGVLLAAEPIYKKRRERLAKHIVTFLANTKHLEHFSFTPNHPTFSFTNQKITQYLEAHNILVTNFNYPNEDSPTMSRIVLSAHHKKKDIELVCKLINTLFK